MSTKYTGQWAFLNDIEEELAQTQPELPSLLDTVKSEVLSFLEEHLAAGHDFTPCILMGNSVDGRRELMRAHYLSIQELQDERAALAALAAEGDLDFVATITESKDPSDTTTDMLTITLEMEGTFMSAQAALGPLDASGVARVFKNWPEFADIHPDTTFLGSILNPSALALETIH